MVYHDHEYDTPWSPNHITDKDRTSVELGPMPPRKIRKLIDELLDRDSSYGPYWIRDLLRMRGHDVPLPQINTVLAKRGYWPNIKA